MHSPKKKAQGASLAVIGAGPGGYPAAFLAADHGFDVTLIDPRPDPGGVCLYEGCIPSKTLLHVARLLHEAREAEAWGVQFGKPRIDIDRLRDHTRAVISKLTAGLASRCRQQKVRYLRGRARFENPHRLSISPTDGDKETPKTLNIDQAIIATGSLPAALPGFDTERSAVWDAAEALALPEIPKTMLVVGGGYIGLEMGTVYAALGTRVTVVEMTDSLLPGVDRDLVKPLHDRLSGENPGRFEDLFLRSRVESMEPYEHGVAVELSDPQGGRKTRKFERVLVAVGRRPHSVDLGLENTAIKPDEKGFIPVDAQCRTAENHLFAIGDVAGQPMLAHRATHEARVAVEAAAGQPAALEMAAIPAVVFTDPEIAWTGLTEGRAREEGIDLRVLRFPWKASGRATTVGRTEGFTKLLVDPRSERILGAGITGVGAAELIAEATLAVEMGANTRDLARTIHPHPTLSETLMECADSFFGRSVHQTSLKSDRS